MKKILSILLVILCGCTSDISQQQDEFIHDLITVRIKNASFENANLSEVLDYIKEEWKEQTGNTFPISEVNHGMGNIQPITITARDISMLDFLRYVCEMSNTSLEFTKDGILIAEIDFSFQEFDLLLVDWNPGLASDFKLPLQPTNEELINALASSGVDFRDGSPTVKFMPEHSKVWIRGFYYDIDYIKTVLELNERGYQIRKRNHNQNIEPTVKTPVE